MAIKNVNTIKDHLKGVKIGDEMLTPEKLVELIVSDDEHEITIDENIHVIDDQQLNDVKKAASKSAYNDGKTAGEEMFGKAIKERFEIDEPGKDIDTVLGLVKQKIVEDAKIPEQQKVQSLEQSLENLRNTLGNKETEFEKALSLKDRELQSYKVDTFLSAKMPEVKGLKKNHLITAFKADGFGVDFDESGNVVPVKNGEPVKDSYEKTRKFEDVVNGWLTENEYNPINAGGRGGKDDEPGGGKTFKNRAEVYEHLRSENIDPTSPEGEELLNEYKE